MDAIVSVTSDWGIGLRNRLAVRNRDDMRRFARMTMGGTVVMGRKTFESFPGGALKGRRNIVVTHDASYEARHEGIVCVSSLDEVRALAASDAAEKVWLIGGGNLYRALLDFCERCYVTKNHVVRPVDTYFPNLDLDSSWTIEATEEGGVTEEGVPFSYVTYRNVAL